MPYSPTILQSPFTDRRTVPQSLAAVWVLPLPPQLRVQRQLGAVIGLQGQGTDVTADQFLSLTTGLAQATLGYRKVHQPRGGRPLHEVALYLQPNHVDPTLWQQLGEMAAGPLLAVVRDAEFRLWIAGLPDGLRLADLSLNWDWLPNPPEANAPGALLYGTGVQPLSPLEIPWLATWWDTRLADPSRWQGLLWAQRHVPLLLLENVTLSETSGP